MTLLLSFASLPVSVLFVTLCLLFLIPLACHSEYQRNAECKTLVKQIEALSVLGSKEPPQPHPRGTPFEAPRPPTDFVGHARG